MADLIYIDNSLVNPATVIEYPSISESTSLTGDITLPDTCEVTLDDCNGIHNPYVSGSLLYGRGYNADFAVYSEELAKYTFRGKIIDINVADKQVQLSAKSTLSCVIDSNCTINVSNQTPAECIKKILTDPVGADETTTLTLEKPLTTAKGLMTTDEINTTSFDDAAAYQSANNVLVDLAFEDTDADSTGASVGDIISQLLKLSHCSMYTYGNIVYLYQWKDTGSTSGYTITSSDIFTDTLRWHYAQDDEYSIKNAYRIAYQSGDSILWASGSDQQSINKYGLYRYCQPDEKTYSSGADDRTILLKSYSGAVWSGDMVLYRFSEPTKIFEFSVHYDLEVLNVGTVVTLNVTPYTGTSMIIVDRSVIRNERKIDLMCVTI